MKHLTYADVPQEEYPVCILVNTINRLDIKKEYLTPFGIPEEDVLVLDLHQSRLSKKTPAGEMKAYIIEELVPVLTEAKVNYLVVTDSEYFKVLTKSAKTEANLGYVMDCVFGPWKVVYVPSYRALFYDPDKVRPKIKQGLEAMIEHAQGNYKDPGTRIIHSENYITDTHSIGKALSRLLDMNCDLTCDIEAFDLKHTSAGIGTITFCWNQHEGIAFPVDYVPLPLDEAGVNGFYGKQVYNGAVRELLADFFRKFRGLGRTMTYHNIAFDASVLIYQLFMTDILDTEGLLDGIDIMLTNWDDTKLISYLATNSCSGNKLGLKDQAQEYSGNYAVDEIKDIRRIPLDRLLRYNLVDGLSTWFVKEKHYPTMVKDQQLEIYETIFKPATIDIVQMQLTGLPVDMKKVKEVKAIMEDDERKALAQIHSSKIVKAYTMVLNKKWVDKRNAKLKVKRVSVADAKEVFNPDSNKQLQDLLYEMLGLPVIAYTKNKQPSTSGDTLKKLRNHTKDPDILDFLNALLDYSAVNKILTSFIPAFERAVEGPDGWHYLFGNFNLGGTVSGRLSSSDPNLQNIPANSKYAKLIKMCICAPPGWVFCGLDFASLEDRISGLTTKDPEKLKVYTDGYDGHAMRAFAYWKHKMPDIQDTVESINSLAEKTSPYYSLRQLSKAPTFALTYQGTFKTLMVNCGFSEVEAKEIEKNYKDLYKVSIKWVNDKLDAACKDGYVTVAFGLRVRTPLLAQVIRGNSKTPREAEAEGRTAGNALGQSWCLLNNRAWSEFMGKVRTSKHRTEIRPCAQIHDAGYALVKDSVAAIHFANTHLVEAVQWQNHPDIWHDEVKLGGEFGIFYPNWGREITIANGATEDEILETISKALAA